MLAGYVGEDYTIGRMAVCEMDGGEGSRSDCCGGRRGGHITDDYKFIKGDTERCLGVSRTCLFLYVCQRKRYD